MAKMDIVTLKSFLDWIGCDLYFKEQPFLTGGDTVKINTIEDGKLLQWIEEYNKGNSVGSDDEEQQN